MKIIIKKDYYALLGIRPNALPREIRSAYKRQAKHKHPDVNHSPGAHHEFLELQEAFSVLSDPLRKSLYDRECAEALAKEKLKVPVLRHTVIYYHGVDRDPDTEGQLHADGVVLRTQFDPEKPDTTTVFVILDRPNHHQQLDNYLESLRTSVPESEYRRLKNTQFELLISDLADLGNDYESVVQRLDQLSDFELDQTYLKKPALMIARSQDALLPADDWEIRVRLYTRIRQIFRMNTRELPVFQVVGPFSLINECHRRLARAESAGRIYQNFSDCISRHDFLMILKILASPT